MKIEEFKEILNCKYLDEILAKSKDSDNIFMYKGMVVTSRLSQEQYEMDKADYDWKVNGILSTLAYEDN